MSKLILTIILLNTLVWGFAQHTVILLDNPSFEDDPMPARPPKGWYFCGPPKETPPDIHPLKIYGEVPLPYDGATYLGLVARDNDTWESIGQQLRTPLRAGDCYSFRLYAARSENYRSISRTTSLPVNYDMPLTLRLYGATKNCDERTLLAETPPIINTQWRPFEFIFQPQIDFNHLILEAYYTPGSESAYNGNLLLDRCSAIIPINCTTGEPTAAMEYLQIPIINSPESLRSFITEQGKLIAFKHGDTELETHFFLDEREIDQQVNKHLWLIAKALHQFPKVQLNIRLGGKAAKKKIMNFHRTLIQLKIPEKQYRLKLLKKKDLKKNWLWQNDQQEFFMNLNTL